MLEFERVNHNSGLSGDSIQRVVQPTVTEDGEKTPSLKFGQPCVMALLLALALALSQHLIDGFRNRDLRRVAADFLNLTIEQYTASQMTYDLRRLRLKGLIFGRHGPIATSSPHAAGRSPIVLAAGGTGLSTCHGDVHRE